MLDPTFMIVPSLACQASCKYCFGPHQGKTMDEKTARETVRFVHAAAIECGMQEISVIFHGGEPLLAPFSIWKLLLEGLSQTPGSIPIHFSVQSNLWKLDRDFLDLFSQYRVSIGTSLDGPKEICDENRGEGYFDRTFSSIQKAQQDGQRVGVIATVTKQTMPQAKDILRFFRDEGIQPVLHAAVRGMGQTDDPYALTAEEYADGIIKLYPWYVKNRKYFSVPTLDHYARAVVTGQNSVCSMQNCLGMFLAISPTGEITSCQRLSGRKEFSLGNIFDRPGVAELLESPAALRLKARQEKVRRRCGDCEWYGVCHGGCYYNAVSMGDGTIDPLCEAYRNIYSFLRERVTEEMETEENLAAIRRRPPRGSEHPLLRSGPYISLSRDVHPTKISENARNILAAYALGKCPDIDSAARYMLAQEYCADFMQTKEALSAMYRRLTRERSNFNNCYIHVSFRCNLRCTHCYASAGERNEEMPVSQMERLSREAVSMSFRQLVITGGEPLFHKDRAALLALFKSLRGCGSNLVLRTNLTGEFSDEELLQIAKAFDQVVVSIDGDRETHDARRGNGSYQNAVSNCERYAALAARLPGSGELSLACVLPAKEINGAPGQSVRALGERLHVPRVRFRPLLPLGRAAEWDVPVFSECINQHETIEDILELPFTPMHSCGIGQNIYICPDGKAYPCYAWQTELSYLGNVLQEGLEAVLAAPQFTRLRDCTVDTIRKCKDCELRYLCGGACRAWGNQKETDPNAAPPQCEHLQKRARELIEAARRELLS